MISQSFYKEDFLVKVLGNKKIPHYPIKEPTVVLEAYPYTIVKGDTAYSLAKKIFGDYNEQFWSIISDLNNLVYPDEFQAGETILLPRVILREERYLSIDYGQTPTNTTAL